MRDKIRRFLDKHKHDRNEKITQADFADKLSELKGENITPARIKSFLDAAKFNALDGNSNPVYYAAYSFFELCRLRDGQPKSEHRVAMEEFWPTGVPTEPENFGKSHVVRQGYARVMDEFGLSSTVKISDDYYYGHRDPYLGNDSD